MGVKWCTFVRKIKHKNFPFTKRKRGEKSDPDDRSRFSYRQAQQGIMGSLGAAAEREAVIREYGFGSGQCSKCDWVPAELVWNGNAHVCLSAAEPLSFACWIGAPLSLACSHSRSSVVWNAFSVRDGQQPPLTKGLLNIFLRGAVYWLHCSCCLLCERGTLDSLVFLSHLWTCHCANCTSDLMENFFVTCRAIWGTELFLWVWIIPLFICTADITTKRHTVISLNKISVCAIATPT